jgi:hypothetical protein
MSWIPNKFPFVSSIYSSRYMLMPPCYYVRHCCTKNINICSHSTEIWILPRTWSGICFKGKLKDSYLPCETSALFASWQTEPIAIKVLTTFTLLYMYSSSCTSSKHSTVLRRLSQTNVELGGSQPQPEHPT